MEVLQGGEPAILTIFGPVTQPRYTRYTGKRIWLCIARYTNHRFVNCLHMAHMAHYSPICGPMHNLLLNHVHAAPRHAGLRFDVSEFVWN